MLSRPYLLSSFGQLLRNSVFLECPVVAFSRLFENETPSDRRISRLLSYWYWPIPVK